MSNLPRTVRIVAQRLYQVLYLEILLVPIKFLPCGIDNYVANLIFGITQLHPYYYTTSSMGPSASMTKTNCITQFLHQWKEPVMDRVTLNALL